MTDGRVCRDLSRGKGNICLGRGKVGCVGSVGGGIQFAGIYRDDYCWEIV